MKLAEFFAEIFFKTNPLPLKDLIKNIGELNARTILAGVGLDGIYMKLKDITEQSVATALALNQFAKATNLPIEDVQRFANAVAQLGGNSEAAMGDLANLQLRLLKLRYQGEPDAGLARSLYYLNQIGKAGITFTNTNVFAFLDKAREGFRRLNKEQQVLALNALGLSESAAIYLRMSDAEWESQKNNMAATKTQIQTLTEMGGAWRQLGQVLNKIGLDVAVEISPALTHLARVLADNFAVMERAGVFKTLADWLSNAALFADALGIGIERIAGAMFKIHDKFSLSNPAIAGATGAGASLTQQNTITIAVNGAESGPAGLAATIAREIENVLKKTFYQGGGPRL